VGDTAVNPEGTRYYNKTSAGLDVGTDDFIVEVVYSLPAAANGVIARSDNTNDGRWQVYSPAQYSALYFTDASATAKIVYATTVARDRQWHHVIYFIDRDGYGMAYANGSAGSPSDVSAATDEIYGGELGVLASASGAGIFDQPVGYVAMWHAPAWLDTHLQADLAAQRYYNMLALKAKGRGAHYPTQAERASASYIDVDQGDGTTDLVLVGPNWLRVGKRKGRAGFLAEDSSINLQVYSSQFDNAAWAKSDIGVDADQAVAPDGTTTADALTDDSTNGAHFLYDDFSASAGQTVASVFVKAGDQSWFAIRNLTATATAWFDVSSCATGSTDGDADSVGAISYGSGWCRVYMEHTTTADPHQLRLYAADGDNDYTYSGTGGTAIYLWGAQVEAARYPSTPVTTTTAAATRLADKLKYAGGLNLGGENRGKGAVAMQILCPSYTPSTTVFWATSDGGGSDDRTAVYTSSGNMQTYGTVGGTIQWNGGAGQDVYDGVWRDWRATMALNDIKLYRDGAASAYNDTSATIPLGQDQITVNMNYSGSNQSGCLVRNVRYFSVPRVP
jgi:hypothetical protein